MASVGSQLNSLASNLQKVQQDGGQFIDAKGDLVGSEVRGSLRGKFVNFLLKNGHAQPGTLSGRFAVALVGEDAFNLLRTPTRELVKTSVVNVLAMLEKLETKGLDADLKERVSGKIASTFSVKTPTRKLSAQSFENLHNALQNDVIPKRRAYRQSLLDSVGSGKPTAGMEKASQRALLFTAEALERGGTDPAGKLAQLWQTEHPIQRRGQGHPRAESQVLMQEFGAGYLEQRAGAQAEIAALEEGIADLRAQPGHDEGQLRAMESALDGVKERREAGDEAFRTQFADVLRAVHVANDLEGGDHVRVDGEAAVSVQGELAFQGVEVGDAAVDSVVTGEGWAETLRGELDAVVAGGNKEFAIGAARDLCGVLWDGRGSEADKAEARGFIGHEAFTGDLRALMELTSGGEFNGFEKATQDVFRANADRFEGTAKAVIDHVNAVMEDVRVETAYNDYVETFGSVKDAEHEIREDAAVAGEGAREFIKALDALRNPGPSI